MYFSVSAPSVQHSLHLFGFSVLTGIDVDGNNSHVLLIFKTSCWLIEICGLSLPDTVAPTICGLQLLLGGRCHAVSLEIILRIEFRQTCSELQFSTTQLTRVITYL